MIAAMEELRMTDDKMIDALDRAISALESIALIAGHCQRHVTEARRELALLFPGGETHEAAE